MLAEDEAENFWPSFADLTSTVALILFVLVLLAYIQNLMSSRHLDRLRADLGMSSRRLAASEQHVKSSQRKLRSLAAEIAAGQAQLSLSEQRVEDQRALVAESSRELDSLRSQLEGIAVLRVSLLSKVKASIEAQLATQSGRAPSLSISDNGNIVIGEKLLFEYDSYAVKSEGKSLLALLATAFANVLADPSIRDSIDVILVQGHTDERGSSTYNRELSAKRANAVVNYMFEADPTLEHSYGRYFASSAYSEFRPVAEAPAEAAHEQNRRIEISVVLKDTRVRQVIDEYMHGVDASLRPVVPPGAP